MYEISLQDAQDVAGGNPIVKWVLNQIITAGLYGAWNAAVSGQIDYAGLAESQGTYYNTVGA